MAIPSRIIEGIYAKELKAEDYYSIYGKDSIDHALEELDISNIQILNQYKSADMKAAIEAKLSGKLPEKSQNKNSGKTTARIFRIASFAAAAVFVAAIALPVTLSSTKSLTPQTTERLKGPAALSDADSTISLYRHNNGEIQNLIDGSFAKQGDVIQITYTAGRNDYGIIFSVDGNGNITRHFPNNTWTADILKHGKDEIPLDFSYELDNAPDFECFIMVTSKKQFDLEDISKRIKNTKDINYLKQFEYLPKKTEAISFVLEK